MYMRGNLLRKGSPSSFPSKHFKQKDNLFKVFSHLFQKAAPSRARSPCRRPQTAKLPTRRFLLVNFFFAPLWSKKKWLTVTGEFQLGYYMRGTFLGKVPLKLLQNLFEQKVLLWGVLFFKLKLCLIVCFFADDQWSPLRCMVVIVHLAIAVVRCRAPSGRELPTLSGEGERVTMKFCLSHRSVGSFRHLSVTPPSRREAQAKNRLPHHSVITKAFPLGKVSPIGDG